MALSLDKDQTISLTKVAEDTGNSLGKVTVGLGWKANSGQSQQTQKRGLFGRQRTVSVPTSRYEYDLDASAFVLDGSGRSLGNDWFVWYGHTQSPNRVVAHSGDNLVGGSGTADDEQIVIHLDRLPRDAQRVVVVVNIYSARQRNQNFGDVKQAFMRIMDDRNVEMARYNLAENFSSETAVTFGELYREGREWKFRAIGRGEIADLGDLARRYGART